MGWENLAFTDDVGLIVKGLENVCFPANDGAPYEGPLKRTIFSL